MVEILEKSPWVAVNGLGTWADETQSHTLSVPEPLSVIAGKLVSQVWPSNTTAPGLNPAGGGGGGGGAPALTSAWISNRVRPVQLTAAPPFVDAMIEVRVRVLAVAS